MKQFVRFLPDFLITLGLLFGLGGLLEIDYVYLLFFSIICLSIGLNILLRRYLNSRKKQNQENENKS